MMGVRFCSDRGLVVENSLGVAKTGHLKNIFAHFRDFC